MVTTAELTDAHGFTIVYDVHEAASPARGVVQLLHGVGEHAGRYAAVIEALTGAGFHVYADDHRGHGRSGMLQHGTADRLGRLGRGGVRAVRDGCRQLTDIIRAAHPDLPLVLLGHSWGSFLAQMLLNRHPQAYDAVVLTGSGLRTPTGLNLAPLNARWKGPDAHGLEWLTRDPSVWAAFREDPLTTEVSLQRLFGVIDGVRLYGLPARDLPHDVPVLLMVGGDDPVAGPRSVHRLARAYRDRSGLTDVTTLVYADARHELFHELQQDQVRADLLAWLDARFPRRSADPGIG